MPQKKTLLKLKKLNQNLQKKIMKERRSQKI